MKDKIIMLLLGIIIGVVIAGACFWFATSVTGNDMEGKGGEMPSSDRSEMMPDQEPGDNTTNSSNSSSNDA